MSSSGSSMDLPLMMDQEDMDMAVRGPPGSCLLLVCPLCHLSSCEMQPLEPYLFFGSISPSWKQLLECIYSWQKPFGPKFANFGTFTGRTAGILEKMEGGMYSFHCVLSRLFFTVLFPGLPDVWMVRNQRVRLYAAVFFDGKVWVRTQIPYRQE